MVKNILIYFFSLFWIYSRGQDTFDPIEVNFGEISPPSPPTIPDNFFTDSGNCGKIFLNQPSGEFTTPFYPDTYPNDTICEWVIEVKEGHIVEINFEDFEVGVAGPDLNDYVMIFESNIDADEQYFYGPQSGRGMKYRSKSNFVIVQFFSDETDNFKGFKANFDSWDAVTFCDKYSLGFDQMVNMEKTNCREKMKSDFYKRCYVSCNPKYILSRSSRVDCENGKFTPHNVCDLVAWEVQLCEITNMAYCIYNTGELVDFWMRKESKYLTDVEADPEEIDMDMFPDPEMNIQTGRLPSGSAPAGKPTPCKDNLIKYSYCVRKLNTDYVFNCKAFLKIKKLNVEVAKRKVKACFECRAVDCAVPVYI